MKNVRPRDHRPVFSPTRRTLRRRRAVALSVVIIGTLAVFLTWFALQLVDAAEHRRAPRRQRRSRSAMRKHSNARIRADRYPAAVPGPAATTQSTSTSTTNAASPSTKVGAPSRRTRRARLGSVSSNGPARIQGSVRRQDISAPTGRDCVGSRRSCKRRGVSRTSKNGYPPLRRQLTEDCGQPTEKRYMHSFVRATANEVGVRRALRARLPAGFSQRRCRAPARRRVTRASTRRCCSCTATATTPPRGSCCARRSSAPGSPASTR